MLRVRQNVYHTNEPGRFQVPSPFALSTRRMIGGCRSTSRNRSDPPFYRMNGIRTMFCLLLAALIIKPAFSLLTSRTLMRSMRNCAVAIPIQADDMIPYRPEPTVWGSKLPFNTLCGEYSSPSGGSVHAVGFSPSGEVLAFASTSQCPHETHCCRRANVYKAMTPVSPLFTPARTRSSASAVAHCPS
jgi:hypothetical protein